MFALPEGSEDEMVILQGVWRELPEPGARPESRKIDLVVSLIERTGEGQRVLPAARGRIDAVDDGLLTPDLDSWGRHLVRELERRAGGRGRRVLHVGNIHLDGVAEPERFRRYLERRWLLPAFSQSRLFRLAEGGGDGSEGALDVDVFVHAGQVEIALNVWDQGVQAASASIEMAQGLLPERYFGGPVTTGPGSDAAVWPPDPEPEPVTEVETGFGRLVEECEEHRLVGRWSEAGRCYEERMRAELARWDFVGAEGVVAEFSMLAPESSQVRDWVRAWEDEIEEAKVFRDCEECPELVVVPAGSFMMGSPDGEDGRHDWEGPVHRVHISEPFAVGVHEVTRGQFARFVRETGHSAGNACRTFENPDRDRILLSFPTWNERTRRSWRNPGYSQTNAHPVTCVSWVDAQSYVRWLSRETGRTYRLLSESEWEYVARAGTGTSRHWGDGVSYACRYENVFDRSGYATYYNSWSLSRRPEHACRDGHGFTAPVGSFSPNLYGLHDALGNVREWVEDCWNWRYVGAPDDGRAWTRENCANRVLRGGLWDDDPRDVRSASRFRSSPDLRSGGVGFRVARALN